MTTIEAYKELSLKCKSVTVSKLTPLNEDSGVLIYKTGNKYVGLITMTEIEDFIIDKHEIKNRGE